MLSITMIENFHTVWLIEMNCPIYLNLNFSLFGSLPAYFNPFY